MQNHIRDLTTGELGAVSGGILWAPVIAGAVAVFVANKMGETIWNEANAGGALLTPQQIEGHLRGKGKPA
jgi:hypothetical protein